MSNTNRTISPGGQNRNSTTNLFSPRLRRLRNNSRTREIVNSQPETIREVGEESLSVKVERFFIQISSYLPTISTPTRNAILYIIVLIAAWKFIIWSLEIIITGVCFLLAVAIILTLLKPDVSVHIVVQVLPPYVAKAKAWLAQFFSRAAETLSNPPPPTPQFAIEDNPLIPRSPRTILSRTQHQDPTLIETNA